MPGCNPLSLAARTARGRRPWCWRLLLALPAVLALAGCASSGGAPAPKEPARLDLTVVALPDVNPDDKGRAAPILVRVYELKTEAAFEAADYFSLAASDKSVLQGDLLVKTEYLLRPGESRVIQRKSHPETTALGILAGYRELSASNWRAVHKLADAPEAAWWRMAIPAHKAQLKISLEASGIRITPND